jgi:hypothetical protein
MIEPVFYPSIEQFRNVIRDIKGYCRKQELSIPSIAFSGTVKLHGTNAGIMKRNDELTLLSRTRVVTLENDNHGFAAWVQDRYDAILDLIPNGTILYGEFCGGNIQKGVAISQLPKMFVAFELIFNGDMIELYDEAILNDFKAVNDLGIFNIHQFPTYSITIDFNNPERSIAELTAITESVENECPVGTFFGVSGVGEGVVWKSGELRFKVKGEKHSSSKVKTLAPVDVERMESLHELVTSILTENRMQQMYDEIAAEYPEFGTEKMGEFLKRCVADCLKEESDTITSNGFEIKDFTKNAPSVARNWLLKHL